MPTNVNDVIPTLNSTQRKKVEARAAELIAEEMTLQQLRRARTHACKRGVFVDDLSNQVHSKHDS